MRIAATSLILAMALALGLSQPAAAATYSFWDTSAVPVQPSDPDRDSVELGLRFSSNVAGSVVGVRFYKGAGNTGTHTGALWNDVGKRIASGTFRNEKASGWQTLKFAAKVPIGANRTYTISYHAPRGHYAGDNDYFNTPRTAGPLIARGPGNGVYRYGTRAFPTQTFRNSNYWVDVIFETSAVVPPPPPPPPPGAVSLGHNANLNGNLPFPSDNPWNQDISGLPVDPMSAAIIANSNPGAGLHPDFGSGLYNGITIGIPYVIVPADQPLAQVNFGEYAAESDVQPYPIPHDAPIQGYGATEYNDRHVLVIQQDSSKPNGMGRLFETFNTFPNGNYPQSVTSWDVVSGAIFDLNSNALRPHGWTSADAAGLPIFPGLIRYEEILAGEIKHAIRFTLEPHRTQRAWVHPATHHAGGISEPDRAPFGARFRLRADFNEAGLPLDVQIIARAMKKYGIILADNGGNWFISGVPDERWDNNNLHLLNRMTAADFELVQMGPIFTQ